MSIAKLTADPEAPSPGTTLKALALQTWGGLRLYPVEVIGETATKYRVRMLAVEVRLPGHRWARRGDEILVPKYAVRDAHENDNRLSHWNPGQAYGYGDGAVKDKTEEAMASGAWNQKPNL